MKGKEQCGLKIVLITPSFKVGGAERVIGVLTNNFIERGLEVHLVVLTGGDLFYRLLNNVKIYKPKFDYNKYSRIIYTIKIFFFLRDALKSIAPDVILSFGGKYNSFNILASLQICKRIFVAERSRPGISYGRFGDLLNVFFYRFASGLIVQTKRAEHYFRNKYRKLDIHVIANPISKWSSGESSRENIILNVGRFIKSKNQDQLIEMFIQLNPMRWKLYFVGSGPELQRCQDKVKLAGFDDRIIFWGNRMDVEEFYLKSEIFAFTSTSEGFPNALGEALSSGCACISYDCCAGPSDLIEDGASGFLIEEDNMSRFQVALSLLINDQNLRDRFRENAQRKMLLFSEERICGQYIRVLCGQ